MDSSITKARPSRTDLPLIIALDVETPEQALNLVDRIGPAADFYKIGMELYAASGPEIVRELMARGLRVFLDLKLYDISETVKRATRQLSKLGIQFLTVHGSRSIMQAAVEGRDDSQTKLLAVTVLTSLDQDDLADLGYPCSPRELVELRVRKAAEAGMDGIVCSPLEIVQVRGIIGPKLKLVIPGVRSAGAATGDQKRVATPAEAIAAGADYLVIGRQVTRSADPRAACEAILKELDELATA
jgi:orotidine-5'-phosphate decarboxylase